MIDEPAEDELEAATRVNSFTAGAVAAGRTLVGCAPGQVRGAWLAVSHDRARHGRAHHDPLPQPNAYAMIRRRAAAAGIATKVGNHSFRATGITAYLSNGGALENAQEMAAHETPRTTKLYNRTKERLTQDEVERIRL
jgi:integrase